jgi:predicted phage terminase large subunit-like protein
MCKEYNDIDVFQSICRSNFYSFAAKAFTIVEPGIDFEWNWHLDCLASHLQALDEDKLHDNKKRLCINVPPRSLKSFLSSIAFPAWVLGRNPSKKFICTSFKFELARDLAQKTRILMESPWYQACFPFTKIDQRQNEKHNFWTTQRGMYYSSAILSVTGRGADYVILDDPINPREGYSDAVRTDTNNTIRSTIPTRFNDLRNAKWLLIMQRLHADDPTGNLLDDRWLHIKLPGENTTTSDITYTLTDKKWTLPAGGLLFEARLSRQILNELRDDLGDANYVGQILQEPVPVGGGEFKEHWLQYYHDGGVRPREMNIAILVDPAGGEETQKKKKKISDWTVMAVIGLAPDNNYYLLDMVRDRLNPTERVDTLFVLHRKWNELGGKPPKVGYEKYGMMTDTHYIREKNKTDAYNFPLIELGGRISKEERIRQHIPKMQNGLWYLPPTLHYIDCESRKFDLISELKSEMASFPRARWDDILDAMARIYEPELFMTFPKQRAGMVQRAIATTRNVTPESWEEF